MEQIHIVYVRSFCTIPATVLDSEADPISWNEMVSSSILGHTPTPSNDKYIRVLSFVAQNNDTVKKNGAIIYSQNDSQLPVYFFLVNYYLYIYYGIAHFQPAIGRVVEILTPQDDHHKVSHVTIQLFHIAPRRHEHLRAPCLTLLDEKLVISAKVSTQLILCRTRNNVFM